MKTTLYMAISLNGQVAVGQADKSWGSASWQNYVRAAKKFGNMVIGSRTYDSLTPVLSQFSGVRVVVVSASGKTGEGVETAGSPEVALRLLEQSGCEDVLVGGGPGLGTSMLSSGLIDLIQLDVEPILLDKGLTFPDPALYQQLKLLSVDRYDPDSYTVKYKVVKS